jgi:hypothetical protein
MAQPQHGSFFLYMHTCVQFTYVCVICIHVWGRHAYRGWVPCKWFMKIGFVCSLHTCMCVVCIHLYSFAHMCVICIHVWVRHAYLGWVPCNFTRMGFVCSLHTCIQFTYMCAVCMCGVTRIPGMGAMRFHEDWLLLPTWHDFPLLLRRSEKHTYIRESICMYVCMCEYARFTCVYQYKIMPSILVCVSMHILCACIIVCMCEYAHFMCVY